jgi:AraC-like DNA-binding protein
MVMRVDAMVHAQSLRGYRELVKDLGGTSGRLLRSSGIDPAALDRLTAFITFDSLIDLLERSSDELNCQDFGLRLAERQDIGILGALAVAMRYSTTVGEAMQCASKYLNVYNAAIAFNISSGEGRSGESQRQARLVFSLLAEHPHRWAQTAEHGIGIASRIMTLLSEGRCHLQQVWFPHAALASETAYRSRFDAPMAFRAETLALAYAPGDLDWPISQGNQELHDVATAYLDGQLPGRSNRVGIRVRHTVEALLGTGTCGHRQVAGTLNMNARTMQRRLKEEGSTFEEVKDEVRRDLAEKYLSQPDMPLTQVTALLDYADQSAFGRSCRRWFHATPREVRSRLSDADTSRR